MVAKRIFLIVLVAGLMIDGAVASYAMEQPLMIAALDHLRAAKAELATSSPDKGDHRVETIKIINRAIEQVKEGIEAGEKE